LKKEKMNVVFRGISEILISFKHQDGTLRDDEISFSDMHDLGGTAE
jgi:hypothetical protein